MIVLIKSGAHNECLIYSAVITMTPVVIAVVVDNAEVRVVLCEFML